MKELFSAEKSNLNDFISNLILEISLELKNQDISSKISYYCWSKWMNLKSLTRKFKNLDRLAQLIG